MEHKTPRPNHSSNSFYSAPLAQGFCLLSLAVSCSLQAYELTETDIRLPVINITSEFEPSNTEVSIDRSEFEHLPNGFQVRDIIKRMPGVYTGGGPGEDKDARLRGLDKEFSRVQFDGIQLPDGGEKRELNIDRIPQVMVGEVRLIRTNLAEHEGDGLAGRVHIEPRPIPNERMFEIDLATGGNDTISTRARQASFAYGDRFNEHFGVQGSIALQRQPMNKTKEKFKSDNSLNETETESKPADFISAMWDFGFFDDQQSLHLKPIFLLKDEQKDKLKTKFKNQLPDQFETETEDKETRTIGLGIDYERHLNDQLRLGLNLGFYQMDEEKNKLKQAFKSNWSEDLKKRETEAEEKQDRFWQSSIRLDQQLTDAPHQIAYGFTSRLRERERVKEKLKDGKPDINPKDTYFLTEDYYAAFIQGDINPTSHWHIVPGVRVEHIRLSSRDNEQREASSNRTDLLPSLTSRYEFNEQWSWHGGVSRVLNRPKFDELSPFENDSPSDKIIIGNPNLKPAKAWGVDTGLSYNQPNLTLGANVFYRDIRDVIETRATGEIRDGKSVEQVQNVGDGHLRGIELEQKLGLGIFGQPWLDPFTLSANQTWIQSSLRNADGTKSSFKDQPDLILNLTLDWNHQPSGIRAAVSGNYVSSFDLTPGVNDGRDSELFVDLRLSKTLTPKTEVYFLVENLTNENRIKYKQNGDIEKEYSDRYLFLGTRMRF